MAEVQTRYIFNESNFDLIAHEVREGNCSRFIEILKGMRDQEGWYKASPGLALKLVTLLSVAELSIARDLMRRISRVFVKAHVFTKEEFPREFFGLFDPFLKKEAFLSGKAYEVFVQFLCSQSLKGAFEKETLLDLVDLCNYLEDDFFEKALVEGYCQYIKERPSEILLANFFKKKYWASIINSFLQHMGENSFMNKEGTILAIPFSSMVLIQQFPWLVPMLAKMPNRLWIDEKASPENLAAFFLMDEGFRSSFKAIDIEGADEQKIKVLEYLPCIQQLIFSESRPTPSLLEAAIDKCKTLGEVHFQVYHGMRYSQIYRVNRSLQEKLDRLKTDFAYLPLNG